MTTYDDFTPADDGLHSPNEKYNIRNYFDGIRTLAHFFEEYGMSV